MDVSRIHAMVDPDIRLGGQCNMVPSISSVFLRWREAMEKSIAKLGGGPLPDSPPDPPLSTREPVKYYLTPVNI